MRAYRMVIIPYIAFWLIISYVVVSIIPLWAYQGLLDKYPLLKGGAQVLIWMVKWRVILFIAGLAAIGAAVFVLGQINRK